MSPLKIRLTLIAILGIAILWPACSRAEAQSGQIAGLVGQVIRPLMAANRIPGMAVGVIVNGQSHVYDYGTASDAPARAVTGDTLFEIGSISKTFNATLAAYAQLQGDLLLSDMASLDLPPLRGSAFDKISLIELGTHTPGGMPLQVPDGIEDTAELMAYLRSWKPAYMPGTMRTYSNLGIGLLGLIAASRGHADYSALLEKAMFPAMGLRHSFIAVPPGEAGDYAQGHEEDGTKARLRMGVLGPETYGVRTTAADLLRFLAINMGTVRIDRTWQRAAMATHTGYFRLRSGKMVQDLVWEQYDLPVDLTALEAGNSLQVAMHANPVVALDPPLPPRGDVLLDKTGSTNGFGAYVAFLPADHLGIVLLANKNYPVPARVAAAYRILTRLDGHWPRSSPRPATE